MLVSNRSLLLFLLNAATLLILAFGQNEFEPDNILKILHNSKRLGGSDNQFRLPTNLTDISNYEVNSLKDFTQSDEGKYFVGAMSASILMIIWLILWSCLLLTSSCCKKCCPCLSDPCIAVVLVTAIIASTFGWFYSIQGNSEFQDGLQGTADEGSVVSGLLNDAANQIDAIIDLTNAINDALDTADLDCILQTQGSGFPRDDVPTGEELSDVVSGPKDDMRSAADAVDDSIATITPILEKIGPVYTGVTATIITLIGIFALTTTMKVLAARDMLNCEKNILMQFNNCMNSIGVVLIFTVGFLLVLIVWILAIIMAPAATAGSDLCIPDLSTNLLQQAAPIILNDPNAGATDLCFLDGTDLSEEEQIGQLLCYYAFCEGNNFVFQQLGIEDPDNFASELVDTPIQQLTDFRDAVEDNPSPGSDQCIASVDVLIGLLQEVRTALVNVLTLVTCDEITPIYRTLVDDQVCNGVVSGIALIYVTWTTGAVGIMVAMYMYLLMDSKRSQPKQNDIFIIKRGPEPIQMHVVGQNAISDTASVASVKSSASRATRATARTKGPKHASVPMAEAVVDDDVKSLPVAVEQPQKVHRDYMEEKPAFEPDF